MIRSTLARAAAAASFLLILHVALASTAFGAASSPFAWVQTWIHRTSAPVEQAAAGDFDGDGTLDLAVLAGGSVWVYSLAPEGPRLIGSVSAPTGRAVSIAAADFDGDGIDDVWIGSTAPGVTTVFRFAGERFEPAGDARYAWDDIVRLLPVDLDGWGRTDLALLTRGGELHVYRWNGTGLERQDAGAVQRGVRFVSTGDIDADGLAEIVLGRGQDHVVVLDWRFEQEFAQEALSEESSPPPGRPRGALVASWENYAWGGPTALAAANFRGGPGDELFLSTSRGIVHVFDTGAYGALGPQGTPQNHLLLPGRVLGTGDLDLDGLAELLVRSEDGLEAWDVSPVRAVLRLVTPAQPIDFVHIVSSEGVMVTSGPWGFARYDRRGATYLRVVRRGAAVELRRDPVVTGDAIYLSAADWEALTGVRLRFDPAQGRATGIRGFHFLVGDTRSGEWIYDGRPVEWAHPPLVDGGDLYLSLEFPNVIGAEASWDPFTRTLHIDR